LKEKIFAPAALLERAVAGLEMMAEKKGLEFVAFLDPDLPACLMGDEQRLRQIMTNLVGNAIKFTEKGQVQVRVARHTPKQWMIQVKDTGMGIPREAHSSIFEPFQQAQNGITQENRGIGLGLAITKQLVELMGGRIKLDSQIGQGSSFTVLLPMKLPPQES
jgi:signal transduction histidine kinase